MKHRVDRGGGVMLYVKSEFVAKRREEFEFVNLELLWVEVKIGQQKIFVGVGYRPPGMTALEVDEFLDLFSQSYEMVLNEPSDAIIIMGDFNDRCTHWEDNHDTSELGLKFFNYLNDSNLFQLIDEPTRITEDRESLLDLIITESPGYIINFGTLPPLGDLDHYVIFGQLKVHNPLPSKVKRIVRHYNNADFNQLNIDLLNAPWDTAFNIYDEIDDIVDYYYGIINNCMDEHIPTREITKGKYNKPWMNGYIAWCIRIRNRWNGTYDRTKNPEHKLIRNRMRAITKREITNAKFQYHAKLKANLSTKGTNIKRFWSTMKELYGGKVKDCIPTIIDNDQAFSTDLEKANLFGNMFSSQCSLPPPPPNFTLPAITYKTAERLTSIDFVPHIVWKILRKLNANKASGPDLIGYRFLKECADSLSEPLCKLFTKSMSMSVFPSKWKESFISPVYKKAAKYIKDNYRPVSLLCCISKVMERVVYNSMYEFFKNHGILTPRNSGFKDKDSTINQLIHLCDNIYHGLDDSKDVCLIFLDVSKAFDKVYHPALLHKLQCYGIGGDLLNWLASYLEGRKQKVLINGVSSDWNDINASVPQGSILGPLLFLIYVNDLVDDLISLPYLFADDTSLFKIIDPVDPDTTFRQLNRDLSVLSEWAWQWRVTFNASKTVYMIVSNKPVGSINYPDLYLDGVKLTKVNSHKHLGVTLTHNMKWGIHLDAAICKANKRLNGIRRIRFLITREARIILYKALVLPILEYGNILYDNCALYLKQRLESVQRQAAIVCTCAFRNASYNRLLDELGWASLEERRKYFRLTTMYKMVNSKVPEYLCDLCPARVGARANYNLRNGANLSLVKANHVKTYNSIVPKTIRDWNSLGPLRNSISVDGFKTRYKRENFRKVNSFNNYDHKGGNMHITRLRLGLSHLAEHLYTHNLIDSPICKECNLENESISHYLLRCPVYTTQRIVFLSGLLNIFNADYIAHLRDNDMVNLFLHGNDEIPFESNKLLVELAQTFIVDSNRFQGRPYH